MGQASLIHHLVVRLLQHSSQRCTILSPRVSSSASSSRGGTGLQPFHRVRTGKCHQEDEGIINSLPLRSHWVFNLQEVPFPTFCCRSALQHLLGSVLHSFWAIAFTPCLEELFTSLLRNHWLGYRVANKYLDSPLQKVFLPTVTVCMEHHLKLSSILVEAHSNHKSVAVCWLDLANAYSGVYHSLIDFSL